MTLILPIAMSGMAAASARLAVSARNVGAVAATPGPAPARVDTVEITGGGTQPRVTSYAPPAAVPMPPGGAAMLGIDLAAEAAEQLSATLAFAANVAVMRAANKMTQSLLDITV